MSPTLAAAIITITGCCVAAGAMVAAYVFGLPLWSLFIIGLLVYVWFLMFIEAVMEGLLP